MSKNNNDELDGFYLYQPVEITAEGRWKGLKAMVTDLTPGGDVLVAVHDPSGKAKGLWGFAPKGLRSLLTGEQLRQLRELGRLKGWDLSTALEKSHTAAATLNVPFEQGVAFALEEARNGNKVFPQPA